MGQLWRWLEREPKTLSNYAEIIIVFFILQFGLIFLAESLLFLSGHEARFPRAAPIDVPSSFPFGIVAWVFLHYSFSAYFEELLFRIIPITAILLTRSRALLALVIIASSGLFGYLHGGILISILFHGGNGIVFSLVYLKFGGLNIISNMIKSDTVTPWVKAMVGVTALHASYNIVLVVLASLLPEMTFS